MTGVRLVEQVVNRDLYVSHLALELVADLLKDEKQASVVSKRPVVDVLLQLVERLGHLEQSCAQKIIENASNVFARLIRHMHWLRGL